MHCCELVPLVHAYESIWECLSVSCWTWHASTGWELRRPGPVLLAESDQVVSKLFGIQACLPLWLCLSSCLCVLKFHLHFYLHMQNLSLQIACFVSAAQACICCTCLWADGCGLQIALIWRWQQLQGCHQQVTQAGSFLKGFCWRRARSAKLVRCHHRTCRKCIKRQHRDRSAAISRPVFDYLAKQPATAARAVRCIQQARHSRSMQMRKSVSSGDVHGVTCNKDSYDLPISTLAAMQAIADWWPLPLQPPAPCWSCMEWHTWFTRYFANFAGVSQPQPQQPVQSCIYPHSVDTSSQAAGPTSQGMHLSSTCKHFYEPQMCSSMHSVKSAHPT